MIRKQQMIAIALMTVTFMGFQNCSKVGVNDLASSNEKVSDPIVSTAEDDGGNASLPVDEDDGETAVTPPKEDHGGCDQHGDDDDGGMHAMPNQNCRSLSQIRIKQDDPSEMQTVACLDNPNKSCAVICHRPPGNRKNAHTLVVGSDSAVRAHLAHGDSLGVCAEDRTQPSRVVVCEE